MPRLIALRDAKAVLLQRSRRQTLRSSNCICISGILLRRGSCVPKYLHDFYNEKFEMHFVLFLNHPAPVGSKAYLPLKIVF